MRLKKFMLLQLFAEGADGSEGDSGSKGNEGGKESKNEGGKEDSEGDGEDGDDDEPDGDKKYSDEDVNKIINRKFAEWEKKKQKEEDEAKKLAKMNAQEKADYKQQQLEAEIEKLKSEKAFTQMKDEARKILKEKNINISDDLLEFMVSADAEETKKAVDSFADLFNTVINEAIKEKARQSTPRESGGVPEGKIDLGIKEMAKNARIIK